MKGKTGMKSQAAMAQAREQEAKHAVLGYGLTLTFGTKRHGGLGAKRVWNDGWGRKGR